MAALYDRAVRDIAVPVPELSPGPGYINLGMWMAVEDPGPNSVSASASPTTWVTVTAVLSETTFDMGNGDVVTCVGAGDPIPDNKLNSIEASRLVATPSTTVSRRQRGDDHDDVVVVGELDEFVWHGWDSGSDLEVEHGRVPGSGNPNRRPLQRLIGDQGRSTHSRLPSQR